MEDQVSKNYLSYDTVWAEVWEGTYGHRLLYSFFRAEKVWLTDKLIVANVGSHGLGQVAEKALRATCNNAIM